MHQFNISFKTQLWLGVGLQHSVTAVDLAEAIAHLLQTHNIQNTRIKGLATVSHRAAHGAIRQLLDETQWQLRGYSPAELAAIAVPNPSMTVFNQIATPSVAEAAAKLAAGGELIVPKQIMRRSSGYVTLAIAAEPENRA